MTGARLVATLDDAELVAGIGRVRALLRDPIPVWRSVGVKMVANVQDRIEAGHGPRGEIWPALLPAYAAIKKGPGMLRESGQLVRSMTFRTSRTSLEIGSNRIYAAVHQFGAVITAKTAGGLRFFLGGGQVAVKTKTGRNARYRDGTPKTETERRLVIVQKVTIPARPYLGIGPEDEVAIVDTFDGAIMRAMAGRAV